LFKEYTIVEQVIQLQAIPELVDIDIHLKEVIDIILCHLDTQH